MKKFILVLLFSKTLFAQTESTVKLDSSTQWALGSGLLFESLGTSSLMLGVSSGYKIRPLVKVGLRGLINPSATNEINDYSLQSFYENRNWDFSAAYNSISQSKFGSIGTSYHLSLYSKKNFRVSSNIGIDLMTINIPSDFMLRLGIMNITPKLGINAVVDL